MVLVSLQQRYWRLGHLHQRCQLWEEKGCGLCCSRETSWWMRLLDFEGTRFLVSFRVWRKLLPISSDCTHLFWSLVLFYFQPTIVIRSSSCSVQYEESEVVLKNTSGHYRESMNIVLIDLWGITLEQIERRPSQQNHIQNVSNWPRGNRPVVPQESGFLNRWDDLVSP